MTPNELFGMADLTTLAGLTAAVYAIVTALRAAWPSIAQWLQRPALEFPTKAAALGIGLALAVVVALLGDAPTQADIVLAVVNGSLAALAATGGSSVIQATMLKRQGGGVYRMASSGPLWWEAW